MSEYLDIINEIDRELGRKSKSDDKARYEEIMEKYVPEVRKKYPDATRIEPIIEWWNTAEFSVQLAPGMDDGIVVEIDGRQFIAAQWKVPHRRI